MKRMKAQLWSVDLAVSIIVFISVAAVFLLVWNYLMVESQMSDVIADMESTALAVSDALIRIPGQPADWNGTNVQVLGLAEEEGVINSTKMERFAAMNYQKAMNLIGLDNYNFYLAVYNMTGSQLKTAGIYPANYSYIIGVERYALYEGKPSKIGLLLWI